MHIWVAIKVSAIETIKNSKDVIIYVTNGNITYVGAS